jgi:hypothetical protein
MAIKLGNVDPVHEIVNLHFEVAKLRFMLLAIAKTNNFKMPPKLYEQADKAALEQVKLKFPDMDLKVTPDEKTVGK